MLYEKIIAVDGEPTVLTSIRLALRKEFEVICFNKGKDALTLLRKPNSINLVLLDIPKKSMDGFSVLKEIKNINKDIVVVMITAYGSKELIVKALQNNADDFIDKPFNSANLRRRIKGLLRKRRVRDIKKMKWFVERNCHNVSLQNMSDEMNLNAKYTSRLFKKRNRCGFLKFKIKVRIDKAKLLLKNSLSTVGQIAETVGYRNPESFVRLFKRITGMTPTEFRKKKKTGKTPSQLLKQGPQNMESIIVPGIEEILLDRVKNKCR